MSKIIGIELGTTNTKSGERLVGQAAPRQAEDGQTAVMVHVLQGE